MASRDTIEQNTEETQARMDYLFFRALQDPDVLMGVLNALYPDPQLESVRV